MGDAPDINALSERIAVLEERMETRQAEYESALDRLRADMAAHREDAAKRDKDNQRWTVGFGIAQIVLTVAVLGAGFAFLGILIGLPG